MLAVAPITAEKWEVTDTRRNSTGVYFSLNVKTHGLLRAPVTVKHSERYDTMVCLTCLTADSCQHSRFVRQWIQHQKSGAA